MVMLLLGVRLGETRQSLRGARSHRDESLLETLFPNGARTGPGSL